MKKTLIVSLFAASTAFAFNDTTWTFDNTIDPVAKPVSDLTCQYVDVTQSTTEAQFADSGLTKGTVIGKYELTANLGKAITLTDGQYVKLATNAYWANGAGKLAIGSAATNSYTIMGWVNLTSTAGEVYIFGTGDGNGSGLGLVVNNGQVDLLAKGVLHHNTTGVTLSTNTWMNLAITYNKDTGDAVVYINGEQVSTLTGLDTARFNNPGGACSYIGAASTDQKQDTFAGQIAEFQILDGALTQQQVLAAAHLAAPVPEPTTGTLSLLALAGLASRRRRK